MTKFLHPEELLAQAWAGYCLRPHILPSDTLGACDANGRWICSRCLGPFQDGELVTQDGPWHVHPRCIDS